MMNNWFISVNPSQFGELKVWFAPTPSNLRLQSNVRGRASHFSRSWPSLYTHIPPVLPSLLITLISAVCWTSHWTTRRVLTKPAQPLLHQCTMGSSFSPRSVGDGIKVYPSKYWANICLFWSRPAESSLNQFWIGLTMGDQDQSLFCHFYLSYMVNVRNNDRKH